MHMIMKKNKNLKIDLVVISIVSPRLQWDQLEREGRFLQSLNFFCWHRNAPVISCSLLSFNIVSQLFSDLPFILIRSNIRVYYTQTDVRVYANV